MIAFHNDRLVPPELCRLPYQVEPKRYHLPVRFHNRRQTAIYGNNGRYPLGTMYSKRGTKPAHIDINLNPIYGVSRERHKLHSCVPSAFVWRGLVEVCLHEFGHVATKRVFLKMNRHEYHAENGRVYQAGEWLANEWMDRCIARILQADPRLGQPKYITGYLGARLAKDCASAKHEKWGKLYAEDIKEARCRKTGAQLTAGNVLMELGIDPGPYTNAYEALRRASKDIGIDYTDGAGRHHKFYTWGDVPVVAERLLARNELRRRADCPPELLRPVRGPSGAVLKWVMIQ